VCLRYLKLLHLTTLAIVEKKQKYEILCYKINNKKTPYICVLFLVLMKIMKDIIPALWCNVSFIHFFI